jgi:hypothetical protein
MQQMKKIISVAPLELGSVEKLQIDIAGAIRDGDPLELEKLIADNPAEALEQVKIQDQHFSAVLLCDAYHYHSDRKIFRKKHFPPIRATSLLKSLYRKLSVDFLLRLAPKILSGPLVDYLFTMGNPRCLGTGDRLQLLYIIDRLEPRHITFPGLFQNLSNYRFYSRIADLISRFEPDLDEVMITRCLNMCFPNEFILMEDVTKILRKIGPERLCRRDESGNNILMRAVLHNAKYFVRALCLELSLEQILLRNNAGQTVLDLAKTEEMRTELSRQIREKEAVS